MKQHIRQHKSARRAGRAKGVLVPCRGKSVGTRKKSKQAGQDSTKKSNFFPFVSNFFPCLQCLPLLAVSDGLR